MEQLCNQVIISSANVIHAMMRVDRGHFCTHNAYMDCPQSIGFNATISAPHMHGYALEALSPSLFPGARVLDIGSGSGYLAVCMAEMVGEKGLVVGVEHIQELAEGSLRVVNRFYPHLGSDRLKIFAGDGRIGYKDEAPYDAIHVGAASEKVPQPLIDQLNSGGRMVIPSGSPQTFLLISSTSQ